MPVLFGVVVVTVAFALTRTTQRVWENARSTERETRSLMMASEIDRTLREYQRLGNLFLATREPEFDAIRDERGSDLHRLMLEMPRYVEGPTETRLWAELSVNTDRYLSQRGELEAAALPLEQVLRAVRPTLESTLASSDSLRRHNESVLRQTQEQRERMILLERSLAISICVLIVLGLIAAALGTRTLVLRPIFDLQDAMRRFRAGEQHAKARAGVALETHELASTFNEMAETIVQQRREQLTFLAGVAHDLRSPLSTLKVAVQMLERDRSTITPERVQRVNRQIDRLTRMVGDLLDASRLEAGPLELQLEDLDLCEPARAMVEQYAASTTTHQVSLRAPDHPVMVRADPLRIEQVIGNLLSNAIKYSPAGGPVELVVEDTEREAELSVSDVGVGIPPDQLLRIFEPFRRLPPTAGVVQGVGLGLAIVRRIVVAHGGRVGVESVVGEGSTFRVRLPLVAVTERERHEGPPREEPRLEPW